jgi:hypothetical protein
MLQSGGVVVRRKVTTLVWVLLETAVPATAFIHFQEDISRAQAILDHANPLPTGSDAERLLRSDLLRSSWMFAIGALDAYFRPLVLDAWITHADATRRLFGVRGAEFAAMNDHDKNIARTGAREQMEGRFRDLIQRRHDCIHNCDRPRVSPQPLSTRSTVLKVIQDVEFFVRRCNDDINTEFNLFLGRIGCNAGTISAAGY